MSHPRATGISTAMMHRLLPLPAVALSALALAPAAIAARPGASTGGVQAVQPDSATLTGSVDPNGERTEWFFEYGPTTSFGFATAVRAVSGDGGRTVRAPVSGLAPATRYRYRLVARNASGVTPGSARAFTTRPVPLGLVLAAGPNPLRFGDALSAAAKLTGTGNVGQTLILAQRPFPFTGGFTDVATAVTNATGDAVFQVPAPTRTTQYQTRVRGRNTSSPPLTVAVAARIATFAGTSVRKGGLLTFSGTVRPARSGALVAVQKRDSKGRFQPVGYTRLSAGTDEFSRFKRRVRVPRGGTYRVTVIVADGNVATNSGREITVRTR